MKKRVFLILALGFYGFSVASGFIYASWQKAVANSPEQPNTRQINWAVVRVNDMTEEKPELLSIWAILLTYSPKTQVFFKPIFSFESSDQIALNLAKRFEVLPDRNLSPTFLAELDLVLLPRSGLIIIDNKGFEEFSTWFISQQSEFFAQSNSSSQSDLPKNEVNFFRQICANLPLVNTRWLNGLPWQQLTPEHLLVHPGTDKLDEIWTQFIRSVEPVSCEIISP